MQDKVVREVIPPSCLHQSLICALVLRLWSLWCVKEYSWLILAKNTSC
jgi:hypothetical protein